MSAPFMLSVAMAVGEGQGAAAAASLATLAHPGIEPVLALHGRTPLRLEAAPPGCRMIQLGPCDAATARNRALRVAGGDYCLWLRPGERLAPHAPGVLARALAGAAADALFVPIAGSGAAGALREMLDARSADGDPRALVTGLWQQPQPSIRPLLSTRLLRARHLHFPAGLQHSGLFFDRAALMLAERPAALDMALIAPSESPAPPWHDTLSVIRALLALFPRTPGFADPGLRLTALASLLGEALDARAGVSRAETAKFDAALRWLWFEADPRLARFLALAPGGGLPELSPALQAALERARELLHAR